MISLSGLQDRDLWFISDILKEAQKFSFWFQLWKKGLGFIMSAASLSPSGAKHQQAEKKKILSWVVTSTPKLKLVSNGTIFFYSKTKKKDGSLVRWIFHHLVYSSTLNTKCCLSRTRRQAATYRTSPGRNHMYLLKLNRNRTVTFFSILFP